MKKLITILLLVITTVACNESKKNNSKISEPISEAFLTAKVDGIDYSFNDRVDLNSTKELSHIINGFNKESKTRITLGLNLENKATGTFELIDNMVFVYHGRLVFKGKDMRYLWHAKESVIGSTGTITITKNNATYLEGTFLFNGVGGTKIDRSVKKITEGKFRVFKK